MRILVTGGRDFTDQGMLERTLQEVYEFTDGTAVLVHGGAPGADSLAGEWWSSHGGTTEIHPANWEAYGKAAGPVRNQEMLDSGIDYAVVFPGGKGTADMVKRLRHARVPGIYAEIGVRFS
jgi:hypothetical protein